jgi:hypothetical protein
MKIIFYNQYGINLTFDTDTNTYQGRTGKYGDGGFLDEKGEDEEIISSNTFNDYRTLLSRICTIPERAIVFVYCGRVLSDEEISSITVYEDIMRVMILLKQINCVEHSLNLDNNIGSLHCCSLPANNNGNDTSLHCCSPSANNNIGSLHCCSIHTKQVDSRFNDIDSDMFGG